jgi:glycosyltransferase involved in cell wall biosynthesis
MRRVRREGTASPVPRLRQGTPMEDAEAAPRDVPTISVVVPVYNEAEIITPNLTTLCDYLSRLEEMYRWELIVVNDGSTDDTGPLAEAFAEGRDNVRVFHHRTNFRLGQALRYAFSNCEGDYVVTFDCDLSYAPEHIGRLVTELHTTDAKIVIASPYAKGGRTIHVPFVRRFLSRSANRFLAATARGKVSTLTGMVRAYDRRLLSVLNLRSMGADINTEILYKAELLGAKVVEIPAHLDWTFSQTGGKRRRSPITLVSSANAYLFSGFMFRPVVFFILPGLLVLAGALYTLGWVVYRVINSYVHLTTGSLDARITTAIETAYDAAPYSFVVGGIALVIAFQLLSLGTIALLNERYFKELFHFDTTLYRELKHGTRQEPSGSPMAEERRAARTDRA